MTDRVSCEPGSLSQAQGGGLLLGLVLTGSIFLGAGLVLALRTGADAPERLAVTAAAATGQLDPHSPIKPPLALMGHFPPSAITPSSTAFQLSPGLVMPK